MIILDLKEQVDEQDMDLDYIKLMSERQTCKYDECNQPGDIIICYYPLFVASCDDHYKILSKLYLKGKRRFPVNLGQVVDRWTKPDGTPMKMTAGKASEITNRTITPDGQVVNKQSKRPAQY